MSSSGQRPEGGARIDQNIFVETLADSLARGESVLLRVQGVSMLPWLREGEKVRILPAAGRSLHRGDIALFWREPGHPILHRIVRVRAEQGTCECLGDSETGSPERVPASAIIGVIETTMIRRWVYLALNPARRFINRLCLQWGLRLRHG
jgi:hypothetical protein